MKSTTITNSSNIHSVSHDGKDLFVNMRGGSYRYIDVPESHYVGMVSAESAGKYLNSEIKGSFDFEKLALSSPTDLILGSVPTMATGRVINQDHPHTVRILGPIPTQGSPLAAGFDLKCLSDFALEPGERRLISTDMRVGMPIGMCAWITPRSGLALKRGVTVLNAPGLIDPDYIGDVGVVLINHSDEVQSFVVGDRIAQIVFAPYIQPVFVPVEVLLETERGDGGFGSTDTAAA